MSANTSQRCYRVKVHIPATIVRISSLNVRCKQFLIAHRNYLSDIIMCKIHQVKCETIMIVMSMVLMEIYKSKRNNSKNATSELQ